MRKNLLFSKNPHTTDLFLFKNAATIFYNCNFNCSDQMNPLMNISINVLILLLLHLLERKVIEGSLPGIKGEFDGSNHGMFPENRHDNGKYAIEQKWYAIDDDESGWESESLNKEQEKSFNSSVHKDQDLLFNSDQVDDMSDSESDGSVDTQNDHKESEKSPKIERDGMPNNQRVFAPMLNKSKKKRWFKHPMSTFRRKVFRLGRHPKSQNGKRKFWPNASGLSLKKIGISFIRRNHRNQRNGTNPNQQKRLTTEPGVKMPINENDMQIDPLTMTPLGTMKIIDDIYGIEQYTDYYEPKKDPFNVDKFLGKKQQIQARDTKMKKVKEAILGKRKDGDESLVRRLVVNGHFVESLEELFEKKKWRITTGTGWKWAQNLGKGLAKSIDAKCADYANVPTGRHQQGCGEHALCILGHLFAFSLSEMAKQHFQLKIPPETQGKLEWIQKAANAIFMHQGMKKEENGQKKTEELPKEEEANKSIGNHNEMEEENGVEKRQELIGEEKEKSEEEEEPPAIIYSRQPRGSRIPKLDKGQEPVPELKPEEKDISPEKYEFEDPAILLDEVDKNEKKRIEARRRYNAMRWRKRKPRKLKIPKIRQGKQKKLKNTKENSRRFSI